MKINILQTDTGPVAQLNSSGQISTAQEALELLVDCHYNFGTNKVIAQENHFSKEFYDLKTGLAGDILQKFSNYDGYLSIIGDFNQIESNSLKSFIAESNRMKRIRFVSTKEEAVQTFYEI